MLEQGDVLKTQLNKVNMMLVICWIFGALKLRQAYTSNLFNYMTLEMGPSDVPETFEETISSESVLTFGTFFIFNMLETFKSAAHVQNTVAGVKLYNIANETLAKMWNLDAGAGALKNIRLNKHGKLEICNLKRQLTKREYDINITSCRKQKRFAVLYTTGPADWYAISTWLTSKLLLKLNDSRLLIFESRGISLFQSSDLLVFHSDNFLKTKFSELLARFSQSGIESLQLKYVQRNYVNEFVKEKYALATSAIGGTRISSLIAHWLDHRCNEFYNPEHCDLNLEKYLEQPVTFTDLRALWLLLMAILTVCILSFVRELQ